MSQPKLSNVEISELAVCSVRTVIRARNRWRELEPEVPEPDPNLSPVTVNNPIQLLQDQLIKKCVQPNPDIRALQTLMALLAKTGKLDITIKEEEECKQQLHKLSPVDLVSIATGKSLPKNLLPKTVSEESLYQ